MAVTFLRYRMIAVKIPASSPKDTLFSISTYAQGGFYMNDSDVLKLAAQFKLETDTSWNTQYTALWKRRCKSSPVTYFIKLFCPQKAAEKISAIKLTRTDSLDFSLSVSVMMMSRAAEKSTDEGIKRSFMPADSPLFLKKL